MPWRLLHALLVCAVLGPSAIDLRQTIRTTDTPWTFPTITTRAEWEQRAAAIRQTILFRAGLWPLPPRTPLNAQIFGRIDRSGYSVEKAYFESVPGLFVTGNLYRPLGPPANARPPYPAVLAPHGHAAYGRLEASDIFNEPARAASLARQGYVVFTYDMVGYNDSFQVPHGYAEPKASLWGFSVLGLQLWDSMRALDFLASLPDVDRDRLGVSGPSGGGTQTFLLTAVDDRVKVAVPANMVSHYMQGGDNCENTAGLRLDYSNVEFAAAAAPRPMLLVSADGDWTRDNPRIEFPAIRGIYELYGAADRVSHVQFHAPHNFNREGREASYAWFATWLKGTPATPRESGVSIESPSNLLVWYGRERPKGLTADGVLDYWRSLPFDASAVQLAVAVDPHGVPPTMRPHLPGRKPTGAVLVNGIDDAGLVEALGRAGKAVYVLEPFHETRDVTSRYFATYNRTADQLRVQDILLAAAELEKQYGAIDLIGTGPGGLTALVAAAIHPAFTHVVADAGRFPTSDEAAYLDRLFIPGFLRAGGFRALSGSRIVIHNGGGVFRAPVQVRDAPMSVAEIAAAIAGASGGRR